MRSVNGIGSGNALETAISTLAARNTTTNNIEIDNSVRGLLTLGTVDGLSGVTNTAPGGTIVITNASPLTVAVNVTAIGNVTLIASDRAIAGDDLTVNSGVTVQSTGGDVTLRGGDNVALPSGSTVDAAGQVTIAGDFGNADTGVGSTLDLLGQINTVTQAVILGEGDNDQINLDPDATTGTLRIDGQGGDDSTFIQLGNLGGQVDVDDQAGEGTDDLTLDATAAADTLTVDATQTTLAAPAQTVTYTTALEDLTVKSLAEPDVINVTPSLSATINLFGGGPTAPAVLGDTLNFNTPVGQSATLTITGPDSGIIATSGAYQDVVFDEIESLDVSGDLIIDGTGLDDTLEITATGVDSGGMRITSNGVAGLTIDFTGLTSLTFNGLAGDDVLIVNHPDTTYLSPGGVVSLQCRTQADTNSIGLQGDALVINDPAAETADLLTHEIDLAGVPAAGHDGSVTVEDASTGVTTTITYTGLEPVIDNLSAVNRLFNFNAGTETIVLSDDGVAGNGLSRIDSSLGEVITFVNPSTWLTVNTAPGSGTDTINVQGLDSTWNASVTLDGDIS